jgi:transposase
MEVGDAPAMGTVNKQSLREEYDKLKPQLDRLLASDQMPSKDQALIRSLLMLFELLVAVFMEKHTEKNSRNSSLPSSQSPRQDTSSAPLDGKTKGKEERSGRCANTRTVTRNQVARVTTCGHCGEDLSGQTSDATERRTQIDIVFEKVVTHVDAEIKVCPRCAKSTKGTFPPGLTGPLQYGGGIKAFALHLLVAQMLSLNRIAKLLKTLVGRVIAEASILDWVLQLHHALEAWELDAMDELLAQSTLHADETSLRVNKKNWWIHVYAAGAITLKFLHPKRGMEAVEDIGILPNYKGIVIHDCWASYLAYKHCGHGLCGSHLLRELAFVCESNGYRWAANMKRLLQETCGRVSESKRKRLSPKAYAALQKRYRNILTRGAREMPAVPMRKAGQKGRIAKSDAHNLLERLIKYEDSVLLFAKVSEVPFTNNRAERDLRMSKVKQKVSGCFRTELFAQAYCRISSYLQTMANKGVNPLIAIQMALGNNT